MGTSDTDRVTQELKNRVIRFYTFKMLVLHCMSLGENEEGARRVKEEYLRTHPFQNLKHLLKEHKKQHEYKSENESEAEEERRSRKEVKKSVIMTSTNFFSLDKKLLTR